MRFRQRRAGREPVDELSARAVAGENHLVQVREDAPVGNGCDDPVDHRERADAERPGQGLVLREISLFPAAAAPVRDGAFVRRMMLLQRSEEHTSELQSLMRISYAV